MQQGVERTWADAISVVRQLLHHRQPEDGLVGRMDEYMNPDEAEEEFPLVTGHRSTIPPLLPESNIDSVVSNFDSRAQLRPKWEAEASMNRRHYATLMLFLLVALSGSRLWAQGPPY